MRERAVASLPVGDLLAVPARSLQLFTPFFDFKVQPAVSIEEGVPNFMKTNAWRDSVA